MKTKLILSLILISSMKLKSSQISEDFLDQIKMIESSGRNYIIGDGGKARGGFQIHESTWNQISKSEGWNTRWKIDSHHPSISKNYARKYLIWIENQLEKKMGKKPNKKEIYAGWNLGIGGFSRRGFDLKKCPKITQKAVRKIK